MPEAWTGRLIGKMHNNDISYEDVAKKLGYGKSYAACYADIQSLSQALAGGILAAMRDSRCANPVLEQ